MSAEDPPVAPAATEDATAAPELTEEERAARAAKNKAKKARAKAKKNEAKPVAQLFNDGLTPEERKKQLAEVMLPPKPQRLEDGTVKKHAFWDTQPVTQLDNPFALEDDNEGPVDVQKKPSDVQAEPYELPEGMEWWEPDVTKEEDMDKIYCLLRDHYVEDDDAMFRFNYTSDFLSWALLPPGYHKDWHVAIRNKDDPDQLIGFISGIPVTVRARAHVVPMCEINFLCVNKTCRAKGLAPLLISEVTRRVNRRNVWQAVYTAGIVITSTIAQCQYWHRSLNPEKLCSIGFSRVPQSFAKFARPMQQVKKHYALADKPKIPGMRPMVKKDHKQVRQLLENYLKKYGVHPIWTNEEICHWFLPRKGVIGTYVVEKEGVINAMCSFYTLPSTVIGGSKYTDLKAAYGYYNVPSEEHPMAEVLEDALILANAEGLDVFNALDIMENGEHFKNSKFLIGDGHLRYYFYNWRFPTLKASNIGMVLL